MASVSAALAANSCAWAGDEAFDSPVPLGDLPLPGAGCLDAFQSRQTLHRLETYDDVPPSRTYVIRGLRQVFEEAGVEFIGSPWDGPGVRLWKQIEPAP